MERNFMSFGYVLRKIQISKVLTSILKSVSFESDILCDHNEFLKDIKNIYLIFLPKF